MKAWIGKLAKRKEEKMDNYCLVVCANCGLEAVAASIEPCVKCGKRGCQNCLAGNRGKRWHFPQCPGESPRDPIEVIVETIAREIKK
jgi:hypothetical protein